MKRNILITIASTVISVLASLVVYNLLNGNKKDSEILKLAGKPGQTKNNNEEVMENADMISEGSQFGVHYYDKHKNI